MEERTCQNCSKTILKKEGEFMAGYLFCKERDEVGVDPIIWEHTPMCASHLFDGE